MHAANQLAIGNDAAAHAGADDKHCRIAAALQGTGPQLCNGCSLAVVFQRDTAAASFAHQLPHLRACVVQKCPAVGDIAGVGIHKAGQRHGDTVHFILMRCIQSVYCVEKMLLRILRRGHGTGIETVHLLVHDRIFDLGASYVKNHDLHCCSLRKADLLSYYGKCAQKSKAIRNMPRIALL